MWKRYNKQYAWCPCRPSTGCAAQRELCHFRVRSKQEMRKAIAVNIHRLCNCGKGGCVLLGTLLISRHRMAQREGGPWRLGESRQGEPSREWEGTQLGNFVSGRIDISVLRQPVRRPFAMTRDELCGGDEGLIGFVGHRLEESASAKLTNDCLVAVCWTAPSGAF